ncbi:hypothetical protein BDZ91DRAFT_766854 [Kalaharituber pfeilii]|nr:hypothetical protein BDZ91DRAFT_766854 [Kalaharituber pfeilii]
MRMKEAGREEVGEAEMSALLALNMLSRPQWSYLSSELLYVNAMQSTGVGVEGGTGDEGVGEDVNETVGGAVGEDIRGTIRGVVGEVEAREREMRETERGDGRVWAEKQSEEQLEEQLERRWERRERGEETLVGALGGGRGCRTGCREPQLGEVMESHWLSEHAQMFAARTTKPR